MTTGDPTPPIRLTGSGLQTPLLGALTAVSRLVARFPVGGIIFVALMADPVLLLAVGLAPTFAIASPLYALRDVAYALVIVSGVAPRRRVTPAHPLGRVGTRTRMVAWSRAPRGAALGGVLTGVGTIRPADLVPAGRIAASATTGRSFPLRRAGASLGPTAVPA